MSDPNAWDFSHVSDLDPDELLARAEDHARQAGDQCFPGGPLPIVQGHLVRAELYLLHYRIALARAEREAQP